MQLLHELIFLIALFLMNFSWFFHMLGYHKLSKPSLVNGVAMAFAFFSVRIAVIPGYYSHMYSVFGTDDFYRLPLGGRSAWVISSVSLDVMNIMWMRRIIRGCLKVLRSAWLRKTGTEMETRKTDWQGDTDRKWTHQHKNLLSLSMSNLMLEFKYRLCFVIPAAVTLWYHSCEKHLLFNNDRHDVIFTYGINWRNSSQALL